MHRPPAAAVKAARRALAWNASLPVSRRGMTAVGTNTARMLVSGRALSPEKVAHIARYFPRHEVDKAATGFFEGEQGFPTKGRIAWDGWGGDAAWAWASKIVASRK